MNLYLISQNENNGYDTYDSAVVAAESEDAARKTYPSWTGESDPENWVKALECTYARDWATTPDQVTAKLIGTASEGTKAGCICASYNAG